MQKFLPMNFYGINNMGNLSLYWLDKIRFNGLSGFVDAKVWPERFSVTET
jgi:hypothetical protein